MIIIIILIFLFYYFIFLRLKSNKRIDTTSTNTKISVIISAQNEENNLSLLSNSLKNLDYPIENYEVILVDDDSTDSTYRIWSELTESISNFRIIKATDKIYEGKRGALQKGIDDSSYNNIVLTDADCEVSKDFLKSYSGLFDTGKKFIMGIAPYKQNNTSVNNIACFDNFWVHLLTFSFANFGLPYSVAARNMGFDKNAFEKVGGYKNTLQTISGDDDLLLREIVKNKIQIGIITNEAANVLSPTKNNFKDFIKQKSRHTSTSNYYTIKVLFVLGLWYLVNYLMLFSIFLIQFSFVYLYLFLFKIIMDILIVKNFMKLFSYKFSIFQIIYLQIIYELLLPVYYVRGLFSKSNW